MQKQLLIKISFIVVFAPLFMSSSYQKKLADVTHVVNIEIKNVRNTKGRIQLQIYRDQESFAMEKPWKTTYVSKSDMANHSIKHTLSGLKPGIYGLALLDDENTNTKMDYGWIMPKEGFGFSDYYHTSWSKPVFNDFKFNLSSKKNITMRIRYL